VEGDILTAATRPSSVGWTTFTNNEGSVVAPGTRRKAYDVVNEFGWGVLVEA
jgi:hypothetical protein